VQKFLLKINDNILGGTVRIPTEAQREYACRAGTQTPYAGPSLDALGWYQYNSGRHTHPVRQKLPNPWGLFDMHGNVYEWCSDWEGDYPIDAVTDPMGPPTGSGPPRGSVRIVRGGSWDTISSFCRSATRNSREPGNGGYEVGFRFLVQSDQGSSP
jgi:formylglycine-generating enzyme required for sulfatase activity